MKSMTGFAQGKVEFDNFSIFVLFKSLNHRFLDVGFKGTGITPSSEKLIKEILKNRVFRGKIEIIFDLFENNKKKWNIQFNEGLLAEAIEKIMVFKKKFKNKINLSMDPFLRIPMIFHIDYVYERFEEKDIGKIKTFIEKIFIEFLKSREMEGESILGDILLSISKIEKSIKVIEKKVDQIEAEIFEKFKEKIKKIMGDEEMEERRIAQEAAITAEKLCVAEEINRLKTHNKRLRDLLKNKKMDIKGREADFLSQEMQRETRTIASKTNSLEVHEHILQIRREIEKIKQQVQNVE